MSNYFPDGRPIQKMMIALSGDVNMVIISPNNLTGNVLQALKAEFASSPGDYPGYTTESFNRVLSEVNVMQISSDSGGWFNLSSSLNKVFPPESIAGGMYIHGAETIRKINVNNCQVILYVKPTP
jgi:hypothetical protein